MKNASAAAGYEQVVFSNSLHGLFNIALKNRLSSTAIARLKAEGLNLEKLLPAYPVAQWRRYLEIAAEDLSPNASVDERFLLLGEQMVNGVVETLVGRAMASLAKLVGPARTLQRMDRNVRNSDNFTRYTAKEVGPKAFEVGVNDCLDSPAFYQGIFKAAATLAGGKQVRSTVLRREGIGCTLLVEWS